MTEKDIASDRLGPAGDLFYQRLLEVHEGLSLEDSAALNARLVLILANCVGNAELLEAALDRARKAP